MQRVEWTETRVPRLVAAMLDGLRFDGIQAQVPQASDADWERAVYYLHRNQLTLIARDLGAGRFDAFYQANTARLARLRATTEEVLSALERAGIQTVLLKGFARAGEYVPNVPARMHYDIDLYCPQSAADARKALEGHGYYPIARAEPEGAGHLVPLARPTTWKWRGDFFDLETPVHVELHDRLWVPEVECFGFTGLDEFWQRREKDVYWTLSRHDTVAYRSMHLLRHLLRGDLRAAGVYEIAYFLHHNRLDEPFWARWQTLHANDLRQSQAVCFALARRWFGCEWHSIPRAAVEKLPERVLHWIERRAASPVENFFTPGKEELGLHFALLDTASAKWRVALRRLVPLRHTGRMWENPAAYMARLGSRAVYHARALAPALWSLLRANRRIMRS